MDLFPIRLKELREESGYSSQQAFANAFGVAQSTVGGWESGSRTPTMEMTIQLAQFFKVTTDYLCGNVNEPFFSLDNDRILRELNSLPGDEPAKEKAPLFSSEAIRLARDYDELDEHGQKMVRMVTDEEKNRIDAARPAENESAQPVLRVSAESSPIAAYGPVQKDISDENKQDIKNFLHEASERQKEKNRL